MLNMELIPADTVVMMIDFQEKLMAVMANKESIYIQANLVLADRKSTRLNSSHARISYAVFCLKKKK